VNKKRESLLENYERLEKIKKGKDFEVSMESYASSYIELLDLLKSYKHSEITLRIVSPFEIEFKQNTDFPGIHNIKSIISECAAPSIKYDEDYSNTNLILHFHGGGFVAMSSFSHENYLRSWANKLKVPIISVDYRKAPDDQYPCALEECYETYKWILNKYSKVFKGKLNRIIVTGDSAGGNLAAGVCARAIFDKIRIPDSLVNIVLKKVLSYPTTYLTRSPSASRMLSIFDPMLNLNFLDLCLVSYIPKNVDSK
jgi:acetyl esterase/lipase